MNSKTKNLFFISDFFENFYYEILRQKERILSGKWRDPFDGEAAPETQQEEVKKILNVFNYLLEEQSLKANYEGGAFGVACYREAQYIMVVLADEIFLNIPWEGRAYWEAHLLEERIFSSHVAGDHFFEILDKFLKERNPLKREIGILYLTCLGLGFRGKYRGFDDGGLIARYREQLFTFIYHQSPKLFQNKPALFPQTSQYTLEGSPQKDITDFRIWVTIFLSVLVCYLILSYGIWYATTNNLSHITTAILEDLKKLR